ncbi:hypothetical protein Dimus_039398 [Dionaea muscipula]
MLDRPWLVTGDFNAFLKCEEKTRNNEIDVVPCDELKNCFLAIGLEDLNSVGPLHTWCNNRGDEAWMRIKLDRAMDNLKWFEVFESAFVCVGEPLISDHSPLIIHPCEIFLSRRRPFKFLNVWTDHPQFSAIVRQGWNSPIFGCPMARLWQKLKRLQGPLRKLYCRDFSDLSSRIFAAKEHLDCCQHQLWVQYSDSNWERMLVACEKLKELLVREGWLFATNGQLLLHYDLQDYL